VVIGDCFGVVVVGDSFEGESFGGGCLGWWFDEEFFYGEVLLW
jgi:hypothetical protein